MRFGLEEAYKSFVKREKFPGCVLFLTLDPEKVDVNVHPAKLEVRFDDERSVYNAVYNAVRNTLTGLSNRLAKDEYTRAVKIAEARSGVIPPKIAETKAPPTPSAEVQSGTYREAKSELSLFSSAASRGKTKLIPEEKAAPSKTVVEKISLEKIFEEKKEIPPQNAETAKPAEKELCHHPFVLCRHVPAGRSTGGTAVGPVCPL